MQGLKKALILLFMIFGVISCVFRNFSLSSVDTLASETEVSSSQEEGEVLLEEEPEDFCEKEGELCRFDRSCKNFCDEVFLNKSAEEKCYGWPLAFYEDFKELFRVVEEEPFYEISLDSLRCFMEHTEEHSRHLFRKLDKEGVREFLYEIAKDSRLAGLIARKDKNFLILKSLLEKLSSVLTRAVRELDSEEGDNFLILLHEYDNRSGFVWLDDYFVRNCKKDWSCPEPLGYYCKILRDHSSDSLEDFFENDYFEKEYEKVIQSKTCSGTPCRYGLVSDFLELCGEL